MNEHLAERCARAECKIIDLEAELAALREQVRVMREALEEIQHTPCGTCRAWRIADRAFVLSEPPREKP